MCVLLITIPKNMCESEAKHPHLCIPALSLFLPPFYLQVERVTRQRGGSKPWMKHICISTNDCFGWRGPVLFFHRNYEKKIMHFLVEGDYCRLSSKSQLVYILLRTFNYFLPIPYPISAIKSFNRQGNWGRTGYKVIQYILGRNRAKQRFTCSADRSVFIIQLFF